VELDRFGRSILWAGLSPSQVVDTAAQTAASEFARPCTASHADGAAAPLSGSQGSPISGATQNVFRTEPLPRDHPFWGHPKTRVTPHIASYIDPATGAGVEAENIRGFEARGHLPDIADARRGY
jgi:hypothetical protein